MYSKKIYVKDTAGNMYECEVSNHTTAVSIANDFFEMMEWPQQDASGRGQRAVVEFYDPKTKKYTRVKPNETLEEANIPDGATLSIYPESISGCFLDKTLVSMADGNSRIIAEVAVGDKVLTGTPSAGNNIHFSFSKVKAIYVKDEHTIYCINKTLFVTGDQKLWSNGEMKAVKEMVAGDWLLDYQGNSITVETISQKYHSKPRKVYSLIFEDDHTFLFAQGIFAGDLSTKAVDKSAAYNPSWQNADDPLENQRIAVKIISFFGSLPAKVHTLYTFTTLSVEEILLKYKSEVSNPKSAYGLVFCKETKNILNHKESLQKQYIKQNFTLIWGEVSEILDLSEQAELLFKIPNEIIIQGKKLILSYINSLNANEGEGARQLLECKLAFLGSGAVGKTSLINMLKSNTYDPLSAKTDGIEISDWLVLREALPAVKVHIWDFGGQEINSSTHRFFLTDRTIYVIVTSFRIDDYHSETDLVHWLSTVNSFAPNSPIVIALNKKDEHTVKIAQAEIMRNFPQVIGFAETSCLFNEGIETLRELILQAISRMPHIKDLVPVDFIKIKEEIVNKYQHYLSYAEFTSISQRIKPDFSGDDIKSLVYLLNDLGILLNITNTLSIEETYILNPEWITKGIFQIIESEILKNNYGRVSESEIAAVLDKNWYPTHVACRILLNLMVLYKFCYRASNQPFITKDHDYTYYFPSHFLPDRPTDIVPEAPANTLRFYFEYEYFADEIFIQFLVTNFPRLTQYWRNGCLYKHNENNSPLTALVEADKIKKRLTISIIGIGNKRPLLDILRDAILKINQNFENISVKEWILDYVSGTIPIDFNALKVYEEMNRETILITELKQDLSVKKLLYGDDHFQINIKEKVNDLIAAGNTDEAVKIVNSYMKSKAFAAEDEKQWTLLQAWYNGLLRDRLSMRQGEFNQEKAKWTDSFIEFINRIMNNHHS